MITKTDSFISLALAAIDRRSRLLRGVVTIALLVISCSYGETSEAAIKYLTEKAKTGDPVSQINLGVCYFNGDGVMEDSAKAFALFAFAAAQKQPLALANLGVCYYLGEGVEQSEQEAVKWFRLSSTQGNAIGQFNLAKCYAEGVVVPENKVKAFQLYQLAAEQKLDSAMTELGLCYSEGVGVEKKLLSRIALPQSKRPRIHRLPHGCNRNDDFRGA